MKHPSYPTPNDAQRDTYEVANVRGVGCAFVIVAELCDDDERYDVWLDPSGPAHVRPRMIARRLTWHAAMDHVRDVVSAQLAYELLLTSDDEPVLEHPSMSDTSAS